MTTLIECIIKDRVFEVEVSFSIQDDSFDYSYGSDEGTHECYSYVGMVEMISLDGKEACPDKHRRIYSKIQSHIDETDDAIIHSHLRELEEP